MHELEGAWRVEREAGLLPPAGISKRIAGAGGWTRVAGVPLLPFRVAGRTLVYRTLPIRDELEPRPDGSWGGRARLLGVEFARFRLVPDRRNP